MEYIDVIAQFDPAGAIHPLFVRIDEMRLRVDRVTDIRPAASLKQGGIGLRYTCLIQGKKVWLYLDDNKWFWEPVDLY
ncbi:MAG: hypothetical protein E7328_04330 [Clostridiales bacterium]|nr:hypothetical protein [Clostridiales bacterium]